MSIGFLHFINSFFKLRSIIKHDFIKHILNTDMTSPITNKTLLVVFKIPVTMFHGYVFSGFTKCYVFHNYSVITTLKLLFSGFFLYSLNPLITSPIVSPLMCEKPFI